MELNVREAAKYYSADFFRLGGGGYPPIPLGFFWAELFPVGGYPPIPLWSIKMIKDDKVKEDKDDDFDGVLPGRPSCGKWTNHLLVCAQERLPQEGPHFCKVKHLSFP